MSDSLLAAREVAAGFPAWEQGAHAGPPLCVLVGAQAHYSIARAAQIMGFGRAGAWPVPVDASAAAPIVMLCRLSALWHLGLFPEQMPHWQWMLERLAALRMVAVGPATEG